MARGSSLLLQPYTSEILSSGSISLSKDIYTHGQANSVPGCTTRRLALLKKKPERACRRREFSVASVSANKYFVHSNFCWSNGRNCEVYARLKSSCPTGRDKPKSENRRWIIKAASYFQVEARGEMRDLGIEPDEAGRLFIFGFGYTSSALAADLRNKNWNITGTCRSCEVRSKLEDSGFYTFLFNSDNDGEELTESGLEELQQATHWLISIPPVGDFDRDPVLAVYSQSLIHAAARGNVRWIGYLSSSGVYGDWQGEWVDEDTEPRPLKPKAVARLGAEKNWLSFGKAHGVAVQVFRLGGIYGAGRNAFSTILQNRTRSIPQREKRRFTSRIHVADVCQVVAASMENPCPGRIYNVVDDDPAPRKEVFAYARDLLGNRLSDTKAPEEAVTSGDPTKRIPSYSSQCEEKRVSNRRIKEELQIQLLHPSYKSGLREIWMNFIRTESNAL